MSVTRRSVLQGLLVAAATVSTGASQALSLPPGSLLVYDSGLPESCALASRHAGQAVDLADERANRWQSLRSHRSTATVVGLTSWSDLVQVRAALEPRGVRLCAEAPCGRLYYWEMA